MGKIRSLPKLRMWRIGVLFLAALLELNSADVRTGVSPELVHRLKRSPQYYNNNCGPPGPPPLPPYWPPPPPPPFWRHHHHPPPWGPPQYQAYSEANAESNANAGGNGRGSNGDSVNKEGGSTPPQQAPCATCGDGSNAVSNAKSDSGQAVAVAIARASTH